MTELEQLIYQCFKQAPFQLPPINELQGIYFLDAYYRGEQIKARSKRLEEVLEIWLHFVKYSELEQKSEPKP